MSLLEAFGCPFGACQNAYTSVDETVYELDVPTDEDMKPMEEALDMIAQFAHAIRCFPLFPPSLLQKGSRLHRALCMACIVLLD